MRNLWPDNQGQKRLRKASVVTPQKCSLSTSHRDHFCPRGQEPWLERTPRTGPKVTAVKRRARKPTERSNWQRTVVYCSWRAAHCRVFELVAFELSFWVVHSCWSRVLLFKWIIYFSVGLFLACFMFVYVDCLKIPGVKSPFSRLFTVLLWRFSPPTVSWWLLMFSPCVSLFCEYFHVFHLSPITSILLIYVSPRAPFDLPRITACSTGSCQFPAFVLSPFCVLLSDWLTVD